MTMRSRTKSVPTIRALILLSLFTLLYIFKTASNFFLPLLLDYELNDGEYNEIATSTLPSNDDDVRSGRLVDDDEDDEDDGDDDNDFKGDEDTGSDDDDAIEKDEKEIMEMSQVQEVQQSHWTDEMLQMKEYRENRDKNFYSWFEGNSTDTLHDNADADGPILDFVISGTYCIFSHLLCIFIRHQNENGSKLYNF